ncbi:MAG TPA: ferrous iron transport protein B, partial [Oligoflexia bacterium]|nr:ferrous iron transport protein B [Oligoflexia bacterium]
DSTNLEVNLYLVLQLIERKTPLLLVLTMSDLAQKQGVQVNVEKLEQILGVPVVAVSARKKQGLAPLIKILSQKIDTPSTATDVPASTATPRSVSEDILARYVRIESILKSCVQHTETLHSQFTRKLDRILLNRFAGPIILLAVLAFMFQSIFSFAEFPMDLIESGVAFTGDFVRTLLPEGMLQSLLVDGVIAGVGSVVVFLPQILILFAFILVLEDSGYMARATFILDRLMAAIGLNGRAFIPLLSSFACAIPGIMATRTIESRRDRFITILISPLMTCSARLPVYALLIAAFIPSTTVWGFVGLQGLVLLGLYLGAILFAVIVAAVLRKTLYRGENSKFVMELPTYKRPSLRNLCVGLLDRAKVFLKRAGTVILVTSIVLWVLATFPKVEAPQEVAMQGEAAIASYQLQNSYAGLAGHAIEPLIAPLGFDWRIGIGLISSFAAREVIVSTLSTVFAVQGGDSAETELGTRLAADPVFTLPTVLALLVFFMLACQCISTLAVVKRETNSWTWPMAMLAYMTTLAYTAAFLTREAAMAIGL